MEWLTQNWLLIPVGGAFAWMMFGRGAGGGCCGGGVSESDARKPTDGTTAPRPADPGKR